ncbi:MAG: GntR family transcriptional regulator [Lachnospiraceae bacterium]|nr:GntR family transcriptional regulator [Lachnospiraceae bacterium]
MAWSIDNDRPVYTQLVEHMKQSIIMGEYKPGDRMPSVRDMARMAGVNPNTMQRAFQEMEREGLMFSNRTAGRFVTEDLTVLQNVGRDETMTLVGQFYEKMRQLGFDTKQMVHFLEEYEQSKNSSKES